MKFAECYCEGCKKDLLIRFDEDILNLSLVCPLCGCDKVKITWIDKNGDG